MTIEGTRDTPAPVGMGFDGPGQYGGWIFPNPVVTIEPEDYQNQAFEAAREVFRRSEIEQSNSLAERATSMPAGWNMLDASRALLERDGQALELDRQERLANSPSITAWVPGASVVDRLNQTAAAIDSIGRNLGGAAGYVAGRSLGMRPQDAAAMAAIGATTGELLSMRVGTRLNGSAQFTVARHADMPSPRPGQHSHHGVMSAWMNARYPNYDPMRAPAVLMPEQNHRATFGVYNTWRAEAKSHMGGSFDWTRVSELQMKQLSEKMFDAAKVPTAARNEYWDWYQRMKGALEK